jgi:hypothetical protein
MIGKPFTKDNPGRPRGSVNKTTKLVKDVFAETFDYLQKDADAKKKRANLRAWAKDNPTEFYKIASKLIPVQLSGGVNIHLSDQPITFE